ncbi:hypothetical protein [Aporhodopirellula aestuarii]|uniref:Uncharacterized protein n=1 Tax=Aporhodopirellula aestuarii TaxID=2950107 RepID=A0ABT0U626_9BACT|nr:hypothetical protein [Aporhodopirellula aestuarii]MCM2372394.1 hypothetical protein [Aporhodopirellula aestuarii]
MAKKSSQKRKRQSKKKRSRHNQDPTAPKPITRLQLGIVITIGLGLAALIVVNTEAMDRPITVALISICIGIALIIVGAFSAPHAWVEAVDDATRHRSYREGGRRLNPLLSKIQKVTVPLLFLFSFVNVLLNPRRTWPAIAWIGSGSILIFGTIVMLAALSDG